ncbi:MAG TPA: HEPN domain-containing protein [Ktedonobacteraceae bacterium]|nr:HEPN domain-containing protein [Ktedonobacteraceae bacterium]
MSHMFTNRHDPGESQEELERRILEGVSEQERSLRGQDADSPRSGPLHTASYTEEDEEEEGNSSREGDLQDALGLFAEAAQDAATASVELGLGRHFACADYCNQVAEKSAQAVSLLRFGRPVRYDHDLRALGERVNAPPDILNEMAMLTPFHPESFYADTPPEQADEVIDHEAASAYLEYARHVLRWARNIVLNT